MDFTLAGGTIVYSMADAAATAIKYAFATETLGPKPDDPDAFTPFFVPRFAYRTYDCIPASPGPAFSDLDMLVCAGLNAKLDAKVIVRLRSFVERAAESLDLAHQAQPDFLKLSDDELSEDPPAGSGGWHLYEAWRQGMATPDLDVARVHKTLHHKRPELVPLLDRKTIEPIKHAAKARARTVWQQTQHEINQHAEQFAQLAHELDAHRHAGDVALSWLRFYDIFIWMAVTHQRILGAQA